MKRGVVIPYWIDRPALEAVTIGENTDRLGYASLWIGETMTLDAFALAGALACSTSRVTLTIGPLALEVRDPAALALGIASIGVLGGRPAHLALGASTPTVVTRWHGRSWNATVARMTETIAALRPILNGERSAYRGAHVATEGFRLAVGPRVDTTLAVAAFGPRMIAAAAAVADRVVVNLISVAQLARTRDAVRAGADAAGRVPPPLTVWVPAALDPGESAFAQMTRQLVMYVGQPGYGEMFTDAGHGEVVALARRGAHPRAIAAAITPELVRTVCLTGGAKTLTAGLEAYAAAGADEVAIVPVTAEDPGGARLLATLAPDGR